MALCVTQSNNLVLQKQDQRSTAPTRYQLGPFGNHQRSLGNHQRLLGNHQRPLGNHQTPLGNHQRPLGTIR